MGQIQLVILLFLTYLHLLFDIISFWNLFSSNSTDLLNKLVKLLHAVNIHQICPSVLHVVLYDDELVQSTWKNKHEPNLKRSNNLPNKAGPHCKQISWVPGPNPTKLHCYLFLLFLMLSLNIYNRWKNCTYFEMSKLISKRNVQICLNKLDIFW